jgi:hypothetical protein
MSLPLEWSPVSGSTQLGSGLAGKYYNRTNVTDSDQRCTLLLSHLIMDDRKKIFRTGHLGPVS